MSSVKVYLNKPNSDNETNIFFRVLYKGKRFKISSGESVHPNFWNKDRQEIKKNFTGCLELNQKIRTMKAEIEAIIREKEILKKDINSKIIKEEFHSRFYNTFTNNDFYDFFYQFAESSKTTKSSGIIRVYNALLKRLKEFETEKHYKISFESINMVFFDKFVDFLINETGNNNNTVGKHIKTLKTFLKWALDREYHTNTVFKKFKVFKEESDSIYLTEK